MLENFINVVDRKIGWVTVCVMSIILFVVGLFSVAITSNVYGYSIYNIGNKQLTPVLLASLPSDNEYSAYKYPLANYSRPIPENYSNNWNRVLSQSAVQRMFDKIDEENAAKIKRDEPVVPTRDSISFVSFSSVVILVQ